MATCALCNDRATANYVKRTGRTTNRAPAQSSGNVSAVRISYDDVARHGGWLKAHAFFVTAVSGAIYMAGGDCHRLSEDKATVVLMAKGVREGYSAVRALGLSVASYAMRVLITWVPLAFADYYWRRFFASKMADYVFGRHARAAQERCANWRMTVAPCSEKGGVEAPALRQLYRAIDAYAA